MNMADKKNMEEVTWMFSSYIFFLVIFLRFLFVSFRENVSLRAVSVYISKSEDGQRKKMAEEMVDLQG